jgi:adenosylhomocysteinase
MDMSFAVQALSLEYVAKNHKALKPGVYPVPAEIDKRVAQMKLESVGIKIDKLTPAQQAYLEAEA